MTEPVAMDRNWGVVAAATIGLIFSLGTLLVYPFGVFIQPLMQEFGWSRTQLSIGVAISQYTFAFTAPLWGSLIDRFGPRAIMVPSIVFVSALVASFGVLTPNLWHYYAIYAAISFTAGGASPLSYSAVLVRKFERHLGLALGLALMGVGLGAATLPPLAQALTTRFGWRGAYVGLGVLTFLITMPAALYATRGLPRASLARANATLVPLMPLIKTRAFLVMAIIFLMLGTISIGALSTLVPLMIGRGFSPHEAAAIAGVTGLMTIAGRGGVGWLLDRFNPPRVVAGVAILALCSFLLLAYGEGTVSAYLAAAMLGGVVGAEVDFTAFFVRRYFGPAVFGRLYGIVFGVFLLGTGTGPVMANALYDRLGSYQPGALLFAGACLVVAALTFLMPPFTARLRTTALA